MKKWLNNKFKNKLWSNKINIKADNKIVEIIMFRLLHDKQIPLLIIKLIIKSIIKLEEKLIIKITIKLIIKLIIKSIIK